MNNNKILVMNFISKEGTKSSVKVEHVREDLMREDVVELMDNIISKGLITSKGGQLMFKDSAEIIERGSSKIDLK
ncbi:DUF2922 domain-containing protein [Clostridium amazonitimonense]|uniref:DUF2922 domain-containing protein n=1 Tax=Clostridium amazonitimonense TaxID=1499689 RepID=UPI000509729A|nr:DUF2922 domain-containing protein [Clostridium amazonitimonense]